MQNEPIPFKYSVFQDWRANRGNFKGQFIATAFRTAFWIRSRGRFTRILGLPYSVLYRFFVEWILGIEIPHKTRIGPGLKIYHGVGLVINDNSILGQDCTVRHNTTIGNKRLPDGSLSGSPILGNAVDIGASVTILGPVRIGDNAVIGAGSIVTKDVPPNAVVAGNPARIVREAAGRETDQ